MKKKKSSKAAATKPKVPAWEKEQVRARRKAGLDHTIRQDEHGRDRLGGHVVKDEKQRKRWVGTAESTQAFEITSAGKVRVRNVDPLKGITSLTHHQREAGKKYREIYEAAARLGIKSGSFDERVDGGGWGKDVPQQLLRTLEYYDLANDSMKHHEIVTIVKAICGDGMSIKEYATKNREMRDVVVRLLKIGLDNLAVFYGIMAPPKRPSSQKIMR